MKGNLQLASFRRCITLLIPNILYRERLWVNVIKISHAVGALK